MGRLVHTGLGSSSLIAHVLHSPPPPREQLCNRSCSNKHTHPGWAPDPPILALGLGSDPLSAWWLGLAPATLEFWVRFPNERNQDQGKQAHPVLKYRVPHGSRCVMGRLVHTSLRSSYLIAHVLHCPPPPPAHSFIIGPAVINTHTRISKFFETTHSSIRVLSCLHCRSEKGKP